MISLSPTSRILVCAEPIDFRKGIDGIAALCKKELSTNPFSGTIFVFRNRKATALKILQYDGQGFWLCQKRLSKGRFNHWPCTKRGVQAFVAHELQVLTAGGDPRAAKGAPLWRESA